jgi:ABC-type nitrate/sulfonate/bicarbonate transport system substrate-binding protein
MLMASNRLLWAFAIAAVLTASAQAQDTMIRIGNAPSIATGAMLIASERGYYREVGIKLAIESLDSSANAIALLAQNQFRS